jgi:flagellar hook-length control protein FliK
MFQLSLLGSLGQDLIEGRVQTHAGEETLSLLQLLAEGEEVLPAPGGELQAMLLQLPLPMQRRLEAMLSGGTSLPQAARSLLSEAASSPAADSFAGYLQGRLSGTPDGAPQDARAPVPPAMAGQAADGPATPLVRVAESPAPANPTTAVALPVTVHALPSLQAPGAAAPPLSPQLAGSLLDMGIPQTVAGRGWDAAIADRVMWMVQGEQQFAKLKLNPPNLGPLEVRVSVQQDQTSVSFVAQHAAVREALEAALPRLRELFDQQSLQLVRADVTDADTHRGGGADDSGGPRGSHGGRGDGADAPADGAETSDPPRLIRPSRLLDLFV